MVRQAIEKLGRSSIHTLEGLGGITSFSTTVFFWTFKFPFRVRLLFDQLFFIGNKGLFIILLTGTFSGMVMCYQMYFGFKLIKADSFVGPMVAVSLARELAPVFSGLVVAGRAGAAMAAEIGTMKVTEQVDALEVMGINAIQYLAVPRVLAAMLVLPVLVILFQFAGNIGSWLIGTKVLMIDSPLYFSQMTKFVHFSDILQGIIKAYFFGLLISLIGTYFGFGVAGGAEGVGKSTNKAVVWGMVIVLVADFVLTALLIRVL